MLQFQALPNVSNIPWLSNQDIANTIFLALIAIIGRFVIVRMIKGKGGVLSDTRRRWLSIVQNFTIIFLILGFTFIWSPQLSTFALSLTAFAVALVVATKEYLLCVVGAIYRATSHPFAVGDWIEIQSLRGEVLTEGILTTKLQEIGQGSSRFRYTGRILTIPNSALLTHTVFNENFRKYHLHHTFRVTVEPGVDPRPIMASILPMLAPESPEADIAAGQSWARIRDKTQTQFTNRDPKINVETTDAAKISFIVTLFCTPERATNVETQVTQHVLGEVVKLKQGAGA